MRTLTSPQLAVLDSALYKVGFRVFITDGDGTYRDYTSQASHNWVLGVDIDVDVDQPISQASIKLRRDIKDSSGSVLSLSPLRTDSILNRNAALVFAPAIDVGRAVRVEVATVALGTTIVSGDWQNLFEGSIDTLDATSSTLSLTCRDLGGAFADAFVETQISYGSTAGVAIQTVMQQMMDDKFGSGTYSLYAPSPPTFNVTPYPVSKVSLMDAEQALAAKPGWDFRFKWDSGTSAWRPTLWTVNRSKTTPDRTITPSRYFDITNLSIDRTNIRNKLVGTYYDSALGSVQTITRQDTTSQAEYGILWAEFDEGSDSPIGTSTEMTTMLDSALADLKDPKADQSIERLLDWSVELGDLHRYNANGVHYNTAQDLAVISYRHSLSATKQRTTINVRGKPAGKYLDWLSRAKTVVTAEDAPELLNLRVTAEDSDSYTYEWIRNATTDTVWYSLQTVTAPLPNDIWDTVANAVQPITVDTLDVPKPAPGSYVLLQIEARDTALQAGQVHRILVAPGQPPLEYGAPPQVTVTVDGGGNWSFNVDGLSLAASYRWMASTSAFPADATVLASGTIANGRTFSVPNGGTLAFGDYIYITVIPYPTANAVGTAGQSSHGIGSHPRTFAPGPQGGVTIDQDGEWSFNVDGSSDAASYKWSASTSAFPSDSTAVSSGTLVNGRSFSAVNQGSVSFGDSIYITVVPFSGVGATGTQGVSIRLRGAYQSFTATKTVYYSANSFITSGANNTNLIQSAGAYFQVYEVLTTVSPLEYRFNSTFIAPVRCTITDVYQELYWNDSSFGPNVYEVKYEFYRVDSPGTLSTLPLANGSATNLLGWQTVHDTLNETTAGNAYVMVAIVGKSTSSANSSDSHGRIGGFYVQYDIPDPTVAL